jgi:hypothetical protein
VSLRAAGRLPTPRVPRAGYLMQYCPALGLAVLKRVGPLRAAQLKGGGSGYDLRAMLFGGAPKAVKAE